MLGTGCQCSVLRIECCVWVLTSCMLDAGCWVPVKTGTQEVGAQASQLAKSSSDRTYRRAGIHVCDFWRHWLFLTPPQDVAVGPGRKDQARSELCFQCGEESFIRARCCPLYAPQAVLAPGLCLHSGPTVV